MMRWSSTLPGDGVEERAQHLVLGVTDLSPEEWDASFGRVSQHHIETAWKDMRHLPADDQKKLHPGLADKETLCRPPGRGVIRAC